MTLLLIKFSSPPFATEDIYLNVQPDGNKMLVIYPNLGTGRRIPILSTIADGLTTSLNVIIVFHADQADTLQLLVERKIKELKQTPQQLYLTVDKGKKMLREAYGTTEKTLRDTITTNADLQKKGIDPRAIEFIEYQQLSSTPFPKPAVPQEEVRDMTSVPKPQSQPKLNESFHAAWRVEEFRRVIILCSLFPAQRQQIERYFSGDTQELDRVLRNTGSAGRCLVRDGVQYAAEIQSKQATAVQLHIEQQICYDIPDTKSSGRRNLLVPRKWDSLKTYIPDVFNDQRFEDYLQELFDQQDGFWGDGILCGTRVHPVRPQRFSGHLYEAAYEPTWVVYLGIPSLTDEGRFESAQQVADFTLDIQSHDAAQDRRRREHRQPEPVRRLRMLCAPAFGQDVIHAARDLGIYLIDWIGMTYLRKFQAEHQGLPAKVVENAWEIFGYGGQGQIWDYGEFNAFCEARGITPPLQDEGTES